MIIDKWPLSIPHRSLVNGKGGLVHLFYILATDMEVLVGKDPD